MIYMNKLLILISLSFFSWVFYAQQPKDTLNTEVINVVKPYQPSISDAFKIKESLEVKPETTGKKEVQLAIKSVPVASTFTPSKGKAKGVTKPKKIPVYNNYISLGLGNYFTPSLEAAIRSFPDRYTTFGVDLQHRSSQGGIPDLLVDDKYYDTHAGIHYKQSTRDMDWKLNFDANHQLYNWYGIDKNLGLSETDLFDKMQHSSFQIGLGGDLQYYNSVFKEAGVKINFFNDNYGSTESSININPVLEFPLSTELLRVGFIFDYIGSSFEREYNSITDISNTYINLGIAPDFIVLRDNFSLHLGAKVLLISGVKEGNLEVFAYPDVSISYNIIDEMMTVYGGATGGLKFPSYFFHLQENPYLSPTYNLIPTDEKYRFYAGLKGKLTSNISYLIKGSYAQTSNQSVYVHNFTNPLGSVEEAYEFSNSFDVVYDDMKVMALQAETDIALSKELSLGGAIKLFNYDTTNLEEAFNLPGTKASVFATFKQGKWYANTKLFFIGERYDLAVDDMTLPLEDAYYSTKLDAYFDMNFMLKYAFSPRLSAFAKVNNIFGSNYERYLYYPVQGIQAMGGVSYKFDL